MDVNRIINADLFEGLQQLDDGCVQVCLTSPPYWGLRDYKIPGRVWTNTPLDVHCEHDWGELVEMHDVREETTVGKSRTTDRAYGDDPTRKFNGNHERHTSGQFCRNCLSWKGAFGLEPTPEMFIEHAVEVFRQVRRVLRDDGTLFVNLGDSIAGARRGGSVGDQSTLDGSRNNHDEYRAVPRSQSRRRDRAEAPRADMIVEGLDVGNVMNMPHRLAAALQADGWYWRSTIIWHKRSPMPESLSGWRWVKCRVKTGRRIPVHQGGLASWDMGEHTHGPSGEYRGKQKTVPEYIDCTGCDKCRSTNGLVMRRGKWRPTCAHEYVFMFSKSRNYFCDSEAVQELVTGNAHSRGHGLNPKSENGKVGREKQNESWSAANTGLVETRNPRSVWTLSTEPFKGAHFATFPTELPKRIIEAATSSAGCCPKCGSCYAPHVERSRVPTRPGIDNKIWKHENGDSINQRNQTSPNLDPLRHVAISKVLGYLPTCTCNAGPPVPCLVLDVFGGSGTVGQVARHLKRDFILTEINAEYCKLAEKRVRQRIRKKGDKPPKKEMPDQRMMFEI